MIKKPLPKDTNLRAKSIVEIATGEITEQKSEQAKKPVKKDKPKGKN